MAPLPDPTRYPYCDAIPRHDRRRGIPDAGMPRLTGPACSAIAVPASTLEPKPRTDLSLMIQATDDRLDLTERPGEIVLDWRTGDHYRHGRPSTCRSCFGPTVLVDDHGRPCHKLCAEADLESERHRAEHRHGVARSRRPA